MGGVFRLLFFSAGGEPGSEAPWERGITPKNSITEEVLGFRGTCRVGISCVGGRGAHPKGGDKNRRGPPGGPYGALCSQRHPPGDIILGGKHSAGEDHLTRIGWDTTFQNLFFLSIFWGADDLPASLINPSLRVPRQLRAPAAPSSLSPSFPGSNLRYFYFFSPILSHPARSLALFYELSRFFTNAHKSAWTNNSVVSPPPHPPDTPSLCPYPLKYLSPDYETLITPFPTISTPHSPIAEREKNKIYFGFWRENGGGRRFFAFFFGGRGARSTLR